jgi:alginate O-acetyltransferase complex protein AlgI
LLIVVYSPAIMLFNSLEFGVFFIVVTCVYFILPHKYRWALLLVSSCYFYMAFVPVYILILGFTIIIDFIAGRLIEGAHFRRKKIYLIISLCANIGVLALFKYFNFINTNISHLLSKVDIYNHPLNLSIILPLGLSFHTFQAMSYTIEVYRGNQKAERNLGIYALYVMFYPQLVAGPIERPQNMLHQFYEKHSINYLRITDGLKLMAWGLFKKVVIADRLAILVDNVYDMPYKHHGLSFIIATICFSFQIFCDFSAYSDIARGAAKVMGFNLMRNFNSPYHSKNIREFWSRWHISLSTWFKDYLYIPMGGNRVAFPKWCLNVLIVFIISGLWHGANWTYIVWGALHGVYFLSGALLKSTQVKAGDFFTNLRLGRFYYTWQVLLTFGLVSFAWIFFRASSLNVALYIVESIFTHTANDVSNLIHNVPSGLNLGLIGGQLVIAASSILFLEFIHIIQQKINLYELIRQQKTVVRWVLYYSFLFILLILSETNSRTFIYFQF